MTEVTQCELPIGSATGVVLPLVSVLVPVRNEADFIERCVRAILDNDYPAERVEILVIDGLSTDGTDELVKILAKEHRNIHLLPNPEQMVSYAMNIGIRQAKGEVILRVDGHAIIPSNFISLCVLTLQAHPEAWCAGGPVMTVSSNVVGRAIASAMSSPIGVGNAMFRLGNYEGYVDTLAFGAYWRKTFDEIGLFDEELVRNQDDELNLRLIQAGGQIYMNPRISSNYYSRSSFLKLAKQYYQYGFWRIRTIQKHKRPANLRQVVPLVFVLSFFLLFLGGLFLGPLRVGFLGLLVIYLIALIVGSVQIGLKSELRSIPLVMLSFAILHFGYGFGSASGVLHFLVLRRSADQSANQGLSR